MWVIPISLFLDPGLPESHPSYQIPKSSCNKCPNWNLASDSSTWEFQCILSQYLLTNQPTNQPTNQLWGCLVVLAYWEVTQEELEIIDELIKKDIFTINNEGRALIIRVHWGAAEWIRVVLMMTGNYFSSSRQCASPSPSPCINSSHCLLSASGLCVPEG
jgi:hypothetical protein